MPGQRVDVVARHLVLSFDAVLAVAGLAGDLLEPLGVERLEDRLHRRRDGGLHVGLLLLEGHVLPGDLGRSDGLPRGRGARPPESSRERRSRRTGRLRRRCMRPPYTESRARVKFSQGPDRGRLPQVAPRHPVAFETLSGRRDSNPRRPPWQGGTLPLSYSREILRPSSIGPRRGCQGIERVGTMDLDVQFVA